MHQWNNFESHDEFVKIEFVQQWIAIGIVLYICHNNLLTVGQTVDACCTNTARGLQRRQVAITLETIITVAIIITYFAYMSLCSML